MTLTGAVARPMLAGIFIYGGIDALRNPETKVKAADEVAPLIVSALGLPGADTEALVRANGALQVVAGTMLGLGKFRRLSAVALAASLAPTTYAGHRFWEELDEERRHQQRIQFFKNVAILGGLVLAAGDTGGRASIPWRARQVAKHVLSSDQGSDTTLRTSAGEVTDSARQMAADVAGQARQVAQSARDSEMTKRAIKATGKAAGDLRSATGKAAGEIRSELPELARLSRRALRSARKAANQAVEEAFAAARSSELSKAAFQAARQAGKQAARALDDADLGHRAATAAAGVAEFAKDRLAPAA
ncbi:MAG: DoxX family protein [Acidimicrobiales bacterium]